MQTKIMAAFMHRFQDKKGGKEQTHTHTQRLGVSTSYVTVPLEEVG